MRFQSSALLAPLLASAASATYVPASTWGTDVLAAKGLLNLAVYEVQQALAGSSDSCTLSNVAVRREWLVLSYEILNRIFTDNWHRSSLSQSDRKAYTDAVLCLMSKPSKTNPVAVPGARSRYDDFLWVHINQTLTIHGTVCIKMRGFARLY
jgi:tyrosinase